MSTNRYIDKLKARLAKEADQRMQLQALLDDQVARNRALLAERDALQAFANEIVSGAFEGGSFDGGDIQDMGVKHGLLRIEQRDDECGEACACREYGFPSECYRKTELLGFAALQGEQP
jgi:hypothetical protein